jgi:hypothetical protein
MVKFYFCYSLISETDKRGIISSLAIKGKGGVPLEPSEPIEAEILIVDEEAKLDVSDISQN